MALFTGNIINKLDRKGRVSVPASFRAAIPNNSFHGIAAYPAPDGAAAIECSGMEALEKLSTRFSNANPFSPEFRNARLALFSNVDQLPFDGEGRILLPARLIEKANLEINVAFVGLGETFQIWEPSAFEKAREKAMERAYQELAQLDLPPAMDSGDSK